MNICKIKDCNNKHRTKGYCPKHYSRFWKYGDPLYTKHEMHGMYNIPEHNTWRTMKDRCYNKNNIGYKYYGGRGITVCDRWRNSFATFFKDMGPRPFPEAQIDRSNNDLGYFPDNCRWTTAAQNSQNRSTNKLTAREVKTIRKKYKSGGILQRELASIYGIYQNTISRIVNQKIWKRI